MTEISSNSRTIDFVGKDLPPCYLLSIDLEDIRTQADSGLNLSDRVQKMMLRYLKFFNDHGVKSTVFVVGELAKKNGNLIREIYDAGHEIGCHTHDHTQLNKLNPEAFRKNLLNNMETLNNLGVERIHGFRAPDYSLTKSTRWAYDVLADLGFKYSSSVLPAKNPLYGWKEFPIFPVRLDNGLWELPLSVTRLACIKIPFSGGVYLRFFPKPVIGYFCKRHMRKGLPLMGYFHPYDIDSEEIRFKVKKHPFFNWLIFYNRDSTLNKMKLIFDRFVTARYIDYVHLLENKSIKNKINA